MPHDPYWDTVMSAFDSYAGDMGEFPPPTLATIAAAEVVKAALALAGGQGRPYPKTMACGVIHMKDLTSKHDTFVVSFSGYHPELRFDMPVLNQVLKEAIDTLPAEEQAPSPRFWYQTAMSSYYVPLHTATQEFFSQKLGVDVKGGLVTYAQVADHLDFAKFARKVFEGRKRAIDAVTATNRIVTPKKGPAITVTDYDMALGGETGEFVYEFLGSQPRVKAKDIHANFARGQHATFGPAPSTAATDVRAAIDAMLASFLALRMDLIAPQDVPATVKAARGFIRAARATKSVRLEKLADYLEAVLSSPRHSAEHIDLRRWSAGARAPTDTRPTWRELHKGDRPDVTPEDLWQELRKGDWTTVTQQAHAGASLDGATRRRAQLNTLRPVQRQLKARTGVKRTVGQLLSPTTGHGKLMEEIRGLVETGESRPAWSHLKPVGGGDLASKAADLVEALKNDKVWSAALPLLFAASGAGPNGQFCAEPKAFDYARNGILAPGHMVVMVGQLAFWHSGEGRAFSDGLRIVGPQGATDQPHSGGYMGPCSSCASRSVIMLNGIKVARCQTCNAVALKWCGRCATAFYCGSEHQTQDWAEHKKVCRPG